jgi:hypothetical protein
MRKSNVLPWAVLAGAIVVFSSVAHARWSSIADTDTTQTLLGIDADNNGIRDDIDAYIASAVHPAFHTHAGHIARGFNALMVMDVNDRQLVRKAVNLHFSEKACARAEAKRLKARGIDIEVSAISTELEKRTFNTKARHDRYMFVNQQASGMVFEYKRECDLEMR